MCFSKLSIDIDALSLAVTSHEFRRRYMSCISIWAYSCIDISSIIDELVYLYNMLNFYPSIQIKRELIKKNKTKILEYRKLFNLQMKVLKYRELRDDSALSSIKLYDFNHSVLIAFYFVELIDQEISKCRGCKSLYNTSLEYVIETSQRRNINLALGCYHYESFINLQSYLNIQLYTNRCYLRYWSDIDNSRSNPIEFSGVVITSHTANSILRYSRKTSINSKYIFLKNLSDDFNEEFDNLIIENIYIGCVSSIDNIIFERLRRDIEVNESAGICQIYDYVVELTYALCTVPRSSLPPVFVENYIF